MKQALPPVDLNHSITSCFSVVEKVLRVEVKFFD
jgi:hypothetical protein